MKPERRLAVLLLCALSFPARAQQDSITSFRVLDIVPRPDVGNRLLVTIEIEYYLSSSRVGAVALAAWVRRDGTNYDAVMDGVDVVPQGNGKVVLKMWFDPTRANGMVTTNELAVDFRPAYGAPGFSWQPDKSNPLRVFSHIMNWSYGVGAVASQNTANPSNNTSNPNVGSGPTGALTRELAAEILNRSRAVPQITLLEFRPGEFERALDDGIVHKHFEHPVFPQWSFTPRGLEMVRSHLAENLIMTPLGGGGKRFKFSRGLIQRVTKVTGITDGPMSGTKIVEYDATYVFPDEMQGLRNYIYNASRENRAILQKYDDGWRVGR